MMDMKRHAKALKQDGKSFFTQFVDTINVGQIAERSS